MAFPTTSVLDDFNRGDNVSLGSDWTEGDLGGSDEMRIVSNAVVGDNPNTTSSARWTASTFGPDSECFATLVDRPNDTGDRMTLIVRATDAGDATWEGYTLDLRPQSADADHQYIIGRIDNGSRTELGARVDVTFNEGDKMGLEVIGSTIKGYRFNGTSWSEEISRTDSNHTGSGNIGMKFEYDSVQTAPEVDDFGGGTVVSGITDPEKMAVAGQAYEMPALARMQVRSYGDIRGQHSDVS